VNINLQYFWLHIFLCSFTLIVPFLVHPNLYSFSNLSQNNIVFWRAELQYLLVIIFFYGHYYLIIPKFYFSKQYVAYGIILILLFGVVCFLPSLIFANNTDVDFEKSNLKQFKISGFVIYQFGHNLFLYASALSFGLLLAINNRLFKAREEKRDIELNFLKAQINPHFLFNVLNNIYALALYKSDDAPDAIAKLSSIMRYVTTKAHKAQVPIADEIEYLTNYVALQKFRLTSKTTVQLQILNILNEYYISPLIIIPFIENAFKYGVNTDLNSSIDIKIEMQQNIFYLTVQNNIVAKATEVVSDKLGIKNAQSQLEFIYPNSHKLNITEIENKYKVNLNITLKK
jgi:sensor histidine kinase YesM